MKPILQPLKLFLIGFCMGVADLIPGVSGGTIAFICGIYDRLINGIKRFDIEAIRLLLKGRFRELWERPPFLFFIPLGLGIVSAILSLSHLLARLFETHPIQLWSFFFGLILGSIVLLYLDTRPWRARHWFALVVATVLTFWIVGLPATHTPATGPYLFAAGCIAISAMILPGISGSYILVILGKYQQVLDAVNARDFQSIGIFLAGMVVGILTFVRIVSWLLRNFRQTTLVALTGIMAGALRTVWPWKTEIPAHPGGESDPIAAAAAVTPQNILPTDSGEISIGLLLLLAGAVVVLGLHRLAPGGNAEQDPSA